MPKSKFPIHFMLSFSRTGSSFISTLLRGHRDIETGYEEPNHLYRLMQSMKWKGGYARHLKISRDKIDKITDESIVKFTELFYSNIAELTNRKIAVLKHPWLAPHSKRLYNMFDGKFIYLQRHPYDIIASVVAFRRSNKTARAMFPAKLDEIIDLFILHTSHLESLEQNDNVNRVMIVKFEDILLHTRRTLKDIFTFLNVSCSKNIIQNIVGKAKMVDLKRNNRVIKTTKLIKPENRWENLSDKQQLKIRKKLAHIVSHQGYEEK